ncbi:DEKNAAC104929 [Brettanomyces naardenensis]|uniref:DEKNAAC104929 n=1 Tax=Brettanomyces naardenensis TaxID=13370 RepID=A0A448YS50_BRENA|nr:DEKNAAC104929 [Brettanomyces naardenensis]
MTFGGSVVSFSELQQHNKPDDCWISLYGHVYDVSEFLKQHPGGARRILKYAGNDATKGFGMTHSERYMERYLQKDWYKGEVELAPEKISKEAGKRKKIADKEPKRKDKKRSTFKETFKEKGKTVEKPKLGYILSLGDFEAVAMNVLPEEIRAYISSGSDDEITVRENRKALGRIFFRPRCLVDVSRNTIDTNILGQHSKLPFLISPIAGSEMVSQEGDISISKVAGEHGIIPVIPKNDSSSISNSDQPVFYQYSFDTEEAIIRAPEIVSNIQRKYPNIKALFVSVDNDCAGNLEKLRKYESKVGKDPQGLQPGDINRPSYAPTWRDLLRLKTSTDIPIILKGLQREEDIVKAARLGFDGALISNHGGRQVDCSRSSIEILYNAKKQMKEKNVSADGFELFVEGGFRRGSDIVKALCLGAKPALGRSILYSGVYGEAGVNKALYIMEQDINRVMKLLGANSVSDLNEDFLDCESLNFKATLTDQLYNENYMPLPGPKGRRGN